MNTPAHMALGLAVLGREGRRGDWIAILAGALLPDFLLLLRAVTGAPTGPLVPVFESIPVYAIVLLVALFTRVRWLALLAGAALIHVLTDLPVHASDARAHFWPLTDAVWQSPLSFWDANHHGALIGTLEGVIFAVCLAVIWQRCDATWQKTLAAVFAVVYLAAFVHFVGHVWAGQHWAIW